MLSVHLKGLSLSYRSCSWKDLPTPETALEWFSELQAGWVHDGDPKKPHAKLASEKCSAGFFLCKRVLKYGNLREILAACIVRQLQMHISVLDIDGVYGAPNSSITLAADVARLLGVPNYIVEKGPKDANGKDTMIFKDDDPIPAGSVLLQIEELITVAGSAMMATEAIMLGNPYPVKFAPFVGVLVYRPPALFRCLPDGRQIVAFIERQVDAWDPSVCPLCKQGSVPLPPKTNWAELTGQIM